MGELQGKKNHGLSLGYFARQRKGILKEKDNIMEICFMPEDVTPETFISIDRINL